MMETKSSIKKKKEGSIENEFDSIKRSASRGELKRDVNKSSRSNERDNMKGSSFKKSLKHIP